jgi:ubiquinone/menaquinone biosynthesis C-methylase UbiE
MKQRVNRRSWSRLGPVLAAAVALSLVAGSAEPRAQERRNLRRFAPQDLGVLEGPDREAWQRPEQIMDALGIADGSAVADLGAGGGWFTVRLARRVGPRGLVYAEDIQREMIESMERRVQREGLRNVRMVLGTPDDPKLRPQSVDAVLFVDSYHEVERPIDLLRKVRSALKANGRLGIVEFRKDGWGPGPPLDERVDENVVIKDAAAAGLQLVSRESFLPYQYLLIFGKA